jgi:hypothetical protein
MPITPCGYAVGTGIFTPAEIHQMQTSITETINRLARGFLTPYATSCPELPLTERLERVAQLDRAYAVALIHGIFADAHQDSRIAGLAEHPRLMDAVTRLTAPWQLTGQIIRVRVNMVDATAANGTLEVLPGVYEEPFPHQQTTEGKFYLPQEVLPDTPPRTLACPAGDVLFLDRFLPHRTLPNQTTTIRWSLVMWLKGQRW